MCRSLLPFVGLLLLLTDRIFGVSSQRETSSSSSEEARNVAEDVDVRKAFGEWEKNCPHVSDNPPYSKLIVTWTLNGAIWLKIDGGNALITNRLTSINQKNIGAKHILRVSLNDHRYSFYHDELTGIFSLRVSPVREADSGVWQCHVEIYSVNGNVEQRSSIKTLKVTNDTPGGGLYPTPAATEQWRNKEIIFERDDGGSQGDTNSAGITIPCFTLGATLLFFSFSKIFNCHD